MCLKRDNLEHCNLPTDDVGERGGYFPVYSRQSTLSPTLLNFAQILCTTLTYKPDHTKCYGDITSLHPELLSKSSKESVQGKLRGRVHRSEWLPYLTYNEGNQVSVVYIKKIR